MHISSNMVLSMLFYLLKDYILVNIVYDNKKEMKMKQTFKKILKTMIVFLFVVSIMPQVFVVEMVKATQTDNWITEATTTWFSQDTTANSFTITNAAALAGLAKLVNEGNNFSGKTIMLGNDINLNSKEWTPIGTDDNPFSGTFDGSGYTLCALTINRPNDDYVGLFGYTTSTSKISNL